MHVLGLKWDHNNDTLVVSRGTNTTITKSLTQRLVLSLVSKVYDPIGLVAPFTVGARLILKDIWRVNGQIWDDELPKVTVDKFPAWCVESKSPSNNNNSNSNAVANQSKLSGVQSSRKTSTLSSASNVKSLLQVTELQLKSSSGTDTTASVLCDTACSNSWVSNNLANRLGLHGTALKLTVKGINTEEVVDTKLVELMVTPRDNQAFEPFKVSRYVKEDLNVGADVVNIKALKETYPHLAVLDPVTYCYGNVEMILGQDVYHAIRPLEYFAADEKCSPFAVRLPIGWILSGPLPSSSGLVSTCFKANTEQDFELASQVNSWYDMESHGALKQVDPRSAADARAHDILENTTVNNGKGYDVGMLWAEDNIELPNNYFSAIVQLKSLEKRLAKNQTLREK